MSDRKYTQEEIQRMLDEISEKKFAKMSDAFLFSVEERHQNGVYKKTAERMTNRVVTKETGLKISKSKKGVPLSEDHKEKLKEIAQETKNYLKAAEVWSNKPEEFRKKVGKKSGKSRIGRTASDEHKENISKGLKGKPKSDEHKESLRLARLNVVLSDEAKENIAKAARVEYVCPHCNSVVKGKGNLSRWHGDNCKQKPSTNI